MSKNNESKFKNYVLIISLRANIACGVIVVNNWVDKKNIEELTTFISEFLEAGENNSPEAISKFFSYPIAKYYYSSNITYDELLSDRQKYISVWPQRNYAYIDKPKLLKFNKIDSTYTLISTFLYEVKNSQKLKSGKKTHKFIIKKNSSEDMKIISIFEFIPYTTEIEVK